MKFSIVTPCYNAEKYIRETILSVINQKGDFQVEYIIMDGGSSDRTLEILSQIRSELLKGSLVPGTKNFKISIISEKDFGMYDAINKGFSQTSGSIMAYINSDDIYLEGAFQVVSEIFSKTDAVWIKGITNYIDENSCHIENGSFNLYWTPWIKAGVYGRELYYIQQDSVFWKRSLWDSVGRIDTTLRLAGDLWLWNRFSSYADLVSFDKPVSCFRIHKNQLSQNIVGYSDEAAKFDLYKPSTIRGICIRVLLKLFIKRKIIMFQLFSRFFFPHQNYKYILTSESLPVLRSKIWLPYV